MKYRTKWCCRRCGLVLIPDQFEQINDRCPHCLSNTLIEKSEKIDENQDKIFEEIRAERKRQDEKWGEQNHPMLGRNLTCFGEGETYPDIDILRNQLTHTRARCGTDRKGWFDILLEEVCEAFLETEPEKQRGEMVQIAAVAVAVIECLDRRIE